MSDEVKQYTLEELKVKLTEKERIYCHEYIIDWNKSRAARVAGYSEDTAKQIGYENFTKPYIRQYIDFIKNNLEEESGISKLRNLQELGKIAYSCISNLHDDWIELTNWNEIKEANPALLSAIESIDTKTEYRTYKTDGDDEVNAEIKFVKIKLFPKTTAIDLINKMLGYNLPVKSDITTNGNSITPTTIVFSDFQNERTKDLK